jgi:hypothetical protein
MFARLQGKMFARLQGKMPTTWLRPSLRIRTSGLATAAKKYKKRESGKTLPGYPWKAFLRIRTSRSWSSA